MTSEELDALFQTRLREHGKVPWDGEGITLAYAAFSEVCDELGFGQMKFNGYDVKAERSHVVATTRNREHPAVLIQSSWCVRTLHVEVLDLS